MGHVRVHPLLSKQFSHLQRSHDRSNGNVIAGVLFQKCIDEVECRSQLVEKVTTAANTYESLGLEELATEYYEQIRGHVEADTRKEYSMTEFERGYASLLSTIQTRVAAMRADLEAP